MPQPKGLVCSLGIGYNAIRSRHFLRGLIQGGIMTEDEILALPFDIDLHKSSTNLSFEVMIGRDGTIVYAIPSHQEFLIQHAMIKNGWTREQLIAACPQEYHTRYMQWLIPLAGGFIPVWEYGILDYPLSKKQTHALRMLKMQGLYKGYIPLVFDSKY